jgi:small neutral amino acid transporter SnatA (MarC family)
METFLPDSVKAILLGVLAIVFVLSRLAREFPNVGWLQVFRFPLVQMSKEEKERRRRSGNRRAALEIVIAGLALPLVYFISTVMFFSEPRLMPTLIVTACSILCVSLGVWIFVRNR